MRVRTVPGGGSAVVRWRGALGGTGVPAGAGVGRAAAWRGDRRRSASLASSAARWRARSDRSPSARACRRQAMRLTSQALLLGVGRSPKSFGVACPQFPGVRRCRAATSLGDVQCTGCSFLWDSERSTRVDTEHRFGGGSRQFGGDFGGIFGVGEVAELSAESGGGGRAWGGTAWRQANPGTLPAAVVGGIARGCVVRAGVRARVRRSTRNAGTRSRSLRGGGRGAANSGEQGQGRNTAGCGSGVGQAATIPWGATGGGGFGAVGFRAERLH